MTEFLEVSGGRIAYDVTGKGPLVVCVPGMGDIRATYRQLVPRLVEAGHRVATMDLRGLGESGTGWPSYSQASVGRDVVALIRHLGGPATVVGHSYSTGSALVAAAESPAEISGVVLIAPWAHDVELNPFMRLVSRIVLRSPALWGIYVTSLYPGRKPAGFADHIKAVKANLREPGRRAAFAAMTAPEASDARVHQARVRQPTLVVMGARDKDFPDPRAEAEAMVAALPAASASVVMIEDAGHYTQGQFPAETAAAIRAFLAGTSVRVGR